MKIFLILLFIFIFQSNAEAAWKFNPFSEELDYYESTTATSPGGSTTQIQYNDSGVINGTTNMTWNKTTQLLSGTFNISASDVNATTFRGDGGNITNISSTLPSLANNSIWIGNGTSVANARTISGDISINNTGAVSIVAVNATNISSGTMSVARMNRTNATQDGYYNSTEWNNDHAVGFFWRIGDGTNAINTTTPTFAFPVPYNATITKWAIRENGGTSGNITIDIQKADNEADITFASIHGAGIKPSLAAANVSNGTNMTNWNTTVTANEWFKPVISGNDTVKNITMMVYVTKS